MFILLSGAGSFLAAAQPPNTQDLPSSSVGKLNPKQVEQEISARIMRVPEFKWIREKAQEMGLRVWLFGGTAAGFAHYVAWDMKREMGDSSYQPNRFDYDYTNIYRSTQDLDIVVDGTVEQTIAFQNLLRKRYKYVEGSLNLWEVRPLRHALGKRGEFGYKEALLDSPDMSNQHTDSNSVGLVEITESSEPVVRDLREWHVKEKGAFPQFLKDVANGQIHYYFSDLHETTSRAKLGENPTILSIIRLLTKAFQYELKLSEQDWQKVSDVIKRFDPKDPKLKKATSKIIKTGKKLIQHAVNVEYAVVTLDQLGLREKLKAFDDIDTFESLAWWMNKKPLPTHPLSQKNKSGKTAKELGITIVAHETKSFVAYESIVRAHTGEPNVLISRRDQTGESAVYGDGFYTRVGREGAINSGLTIRFNLDPEAREGVDFLLAASGFVIILNKSAIKVIPESLNMTLPEYFEFLSNSEISSSDRGILEKFKRKLERMVSEATPEDLAHVRGVLERSILNKQSSKKIPNVTLLTEWLGLEESIKYPELVIGMIKTLFAEDPESPFSKDALIAVVKAILDLPAWNEKLETGKLPDLVNTINEVLRPGVRNWVINDSGQSQTFFGFGDSPAAGQSRWIFTEMGITLGDEFLSLAKNEHMYEGFLFSLFEHTAWKTKRSDIFEMMLSTMENSIQSKGFADPQAARGLGRLLKNEIWLDDPRAMELFELLIRANHRNNSFSDSFFAFMPAKNYPKVQRQIGRTLEYIKEALKKGDLEPATQEGAQLMSIYGKDAGLKLPNWAEVISVLRKIPELKDRFIPELPMHLVDEYELKMQKANSPRSSECAKTISNL